MNAHEKLDSFLNSSPRVKAGIILAIIAAILLTLFIVFQFGKSRMMPQIAGEKSAKEIRLEKENELSQMREKGLRDDANKLLAQNEILKAQNEAQAEILTANGKRIDSVKVENLNKLSEKLNEKYDQISSSVDDVNVQRHHLCAEAASAGYKLSDEFCRN